MQNHLKRNLIIKSLRIVVAKIYISIINIYTNNPPNWSLIVVAMILYTNQTLIRKPQTGNQTMATFTWWILLSIRIFKVFIYMVHTILRCWKHWNLLLSWWLLFRFPPPPSPPLPALEIVCFHSCPQHSLDSTWNALLIKKRHKNSNLLAL